MFPNALPTIRRFAGVVALASLLASCAVVAPPPGETVKDPSPGETVKASPETPAPFSSAASGAEVPSGWQPWIIHPRKRKTRYRIESETGGTVLLAHASGSASGLMARVAVDPRRRPVLRWRWRADALVADADNADASREDAPLRVVLAFDGDKSRLPVRDRMFFERVKLLSGNDLPFATLMYIWENKRPVGTVIQNPHSARIRKLVVDSGPRELRRWRLHRRNIVEDYRRAFGTEPGRLIGVAVLTDTDNTGTDVSAAYGDIELLER